MEITSHRYKPDTVVCILDEADIASDPSLAAHFEKTHASLLRGPNGLEIIYVDGRLPELQHGPGYRPEVLDVMIAHELGHMYYGPQHGAQPNRPYEEREADDVAWVVLSTHGDAAAICLHEREYEARWGYRLECFDNPSGDTDGWPHSRRQPAEITQWCKQIAGMVE